MIASLLVGTRPRSEEERPLFEAAVDSKVGPRRRAVLLERLVPLELVREESRRDPLALAALRFWMEVELLKMAVRAGSRPVLALRLYAYSADVEHHVRLLPVPARVRLLARFER